MKKGIVETLRKSTLDENLQKEAENWQADTEDVAVVLTNKDLRLSYSKMRHERDIRQVRRVVLEKKRDA